MIDYGKYRFRFIACGGREHATYEFLHERSLHRLEIFHQPPGTDIVNDGLVINLNGVNAVLALDILQEYNRFRTEEYTKGRAEMERRYGASILEDYPAADPTEQTIAWSAKTADDGKNCTYTWYRVNLAGEQEVVREHSFSYR